MNINKITEYIEIKMKAVNLFLMDHHHEIITNFEIIGCSFCINAVFVVYTLRMTKLQLLTSIKMNKNGLEK